jgi:hypothetical protein
MNDELILNALASNQFRYLRNNDDSWTLGYYDDNDVLQTKTDRTLDDLIEWWSRKVDEA